MDFPHGQDDEVSKESVKRKHRNRRKKGGRFVPYDRSDRAPLPEDLNVKWKLDEENFR